MLLIHKIRSLTRIGLVKFGKSKSVLLILLFLSFSVISCQTLEYPAERGAVEKPLHDFFEQSDVFSQSITGFALYDPESDSLLYNRDADRFFTPASNTKMLTLYAALQVLPDILPALRYVVQDDTLYFRGTGDPSFLNPNMEESREVLDFLRDHEEPLVYYDGHYTDRHFGSGWSWDWYPAAYAPEKSPFPVYGNMMRLQVQQIALLKLDEEEPVKPAFFKRYIDHKGWDGDQTELVRRDYETNELLYAPKSDTVRQERNIPFKYSGELFVEMLADTLQRDIGITEREDLDFSSTLHVSPLDTLLKRMMIVSDNLIAEQLMLMVAEQEFGEMNTEKAIQWALDEHFSDLPQTPRWNDGSGLTRYNLVTPHSLVILLEKLMREYDEERVLSWFPAGGESGTIRNWYHAPDGEPPYVYAKTGTLRNNTALSGYVYTDSGRRLNFSFLNNNYVISNNELRREMQNVLEFIKNEY